MNKNHKLGVDESADISIVIMKMGTGYVIFDAVCIVVFVIFFLLSAWYDVTSGFIFFFICIIGSIINFFYRKTRKVIVENNTIIEKKMLRKQKKIEFGEVDYLTLTRGNNSDEICVHSKIGVSIKIPKYFQNVDMFEVLISKQHWKSK